MFDDSAPVLTPEIDLMPEGADESAAAEIRMQVWGILTTLYPRTQPVERRGQTRYPFPYLIHLTPIGDDGRTPSGSGMVVVGKHLSEKGLGFYHPQPLPYRRMIASFESVAGRPTAFLIDLSWCRFTRQGWYESGGKFLDTALPPEDRHPAD